VLDQFVPPFLKGHDGDDTNAIGEGMRRIPMTTQSILQTPSLSRRDWLKLSACGAFGVSLSRWLPAFAEEAAASKQRRRSCILLWMSGGPSQMDTFDLKPGHANGGPYKTIETSVPGIEISEHLPRLARQMEHCAVIRSMTTKEGDHTRATYLLRTGYLPQGPVQSPTLGSVWSRELGSAE